MKDEFPLPIRLTYFNKDGDAVYGRGVNDDIRNVPRLIAEEMLTGSGVVRVTVDIALPDPAEDRMAWTAVAGSPFLEE